MDTINQPVRCSQRQVNCKLPLSCEVVKNRYFWASNFWGITPKKSLHSVQLPTDTLHVLHGVYMVRIFFEMSHKTDMAT